MPLAPYPVIVRDLSRCGPASFTWNGLDPDDAVGDINEEYLERFRAVNSLACVGYVIACTEWIFWFVRERLMPSDANDYEQYIQAHWVWICELPRKVPPQAYESARKQVAFSPYNDAVELGLESITNGIASVPDAETGVDAVFMSQLCEYTLPENCGYISWREEIVSRLTRAFPFSSYRDLRVSRRIFDTDIDANTVDHEKDCSSMLTEAEILMNRYLPLKNAK
ncbi:MAG: hypothetical protein U1E38_10015 [Rhodospirillales bacterium]